MINAYCISGLGVDGRLFQELKLDHCIIHHIKWETVLSEDTLSTYAMRLSKNIDQSRPFALIGVSFGGMCCTEITRELKPLKTFIISSCKSSEELPLIAKIAKVLPLYKLWNDRFFVRFALLFKKRFGVVTKEYSILFKKMLEATPENYFRSAVHCLANWGKRPVPKDIIHIHGTADKIIPYKKIRNCDHTIKNGTHWMIMERAEEISSIINEELKKSG